MNLREELKADIVGAALIRDWLGDGGETVSACRAEARAFVCLNCPFHDPQHWWISHFKNAIARAIKLTLEYKNKASLKLSVENRIGECSKCKCVLALKCWVPTERLADHFDLSTLNYYPEFCWIRSEISDTIKA